MAGLEPDHKKVLWCDRGRALGDEFEEVYVDGIGACNAQECFLRSLRIDPSYPPSWKHLQHTFTSEQVLEIDGESYDLEKSSAKYAELTSTQ